MKPEFASTPADTRPILLVPYTWIGDFVRAHSVVRLLNARWPERSVDVLTSGLCAPLLDYMPGVRRGVRADFTHGSLDFSERLRVSSQLRKGDYGTAIVLPRTWKAALAPFLAGIPERIGFIGEGRFGLLNDYRWGERKLPRMVDRCAALALAPGASARGEWPVPQLVVKEEDVARWFCAKGLRDDALVVLAPGAVGPSKRWPAASYASVARELCAEGYSVAVIGGPGEKGLAQEIVAQAGAGTADLTGLDLRDAILALAGAKLAISNDSGLLHVAAALGTPTIGIFGPTSPWHWAPLNPLAATIETDTVVPCRPCHQPVCRFGHHRCMVDIGADRVTAAARASLGSSHRTASSAPSTSMAATFAPR